MLIVHRHSNFLGFDYFGRIVCVILVVVFGNDLILSCSPLKVRGLASLNHTRITYNVRPVACGTRIITQKINVKTDKDGWRIKERHEKGMRQGK